MRVVEQYGCAGERPAHQTAGIIGIVAAEAREHLRNRFGGKAECVGKQCRAGDIRDVVRCCAAHCQRHLGDLAERMIRAVAMQNQFAVAHAAGRTRARAMRDQQGVIGVEREPGKAARQRGGAPYQRVVVRIEDQSSAGSQRTSHDELGVGQSVEIADAVFAEMIGADIGDDGRLHALDGEATTQDSAARGFEDCGLGARIAQYRTRTGRAGIVAARNRLAVDEYAIGAAESRARAMQFAHRRGEARRRGLAIRPGNERDGNRVQRRPIDRSDCRQCIERPGARAAAFAQSQIAVVEQHGQLTPLRCIEQGGQNWSAFGRCRAT